MGVSKHKSCQFDRFQTGITVDTVELVNDPFAGSLAACHRGDDLRECIDIREGMRGTRVVWR